MNLHVDLDRGLVKLRLIDINHDLICIGRPAVKVITYLSDIKSAAQRQDKIAALHYEVAAAGTDCARTSAVIRVVIVNKIVCVPRGNYRNLEHIHYLKHLILHACESDAFADDHYRTLCLADKIKDLSCESLIVNGLLLSKYLLLFFTSLEMTKLHRVHGSCLHVERNINPNGALTAGVREAPCLFEVVVNLLRLGDHNGILCHTGDRIHDGELLVAELS